MNMNRDCFLFASGAFFGFAVSPEHFNPGKSMSRPRYYSPAIKRHLVTALYHEAKRQRRPMTDLTNKILETALREMESQRPTQLGTEAMVLHESPPPCSTR
jgi:hypothetical protein